MPFRSSSNPSKGIQSQLSNIFGLPSLDFPIPKYDIILEFDV
jgi:hypothetical protein